MANKVAADAHEAPAGTSEASTAFSCEPVVAPISRWRLIAALQIAEAFAAVTSSCSWLRDIGTEESSRPSLFELFRFALAVAVVVHFVLRSLGAYDFGGILNVWRSSATAAAAWTLATAPLLSMLINPERHGALFWRDPFLDWLAGGALIVLVRLAAGYAGAALLLARRLNHNVVVIGNGSEAQLCTRLLRSDRSGAHIVGFISLEDECCDLSRADRDGSFITKFQRLIRMRHVKDVIVATAEGDREQIPDLVRGLLCLPVRVLLWPRSIGVEAEWIASSECKIGEAPLLLASTPPLDGWRWV